MTIPCDDSPRLGAERGGSDVGSFDEFFRDRYSATVRLAHLLTGSNDVAEELAQDAFASLHERFDSVREPRSYLRAATVNLCRNWHRRNKRELDRFRRHGSSETDTTDATDEMIDIIARLPYRQRAVLVLRYWLDLSEADIAEMLSCRPGTVKSLHSRALVAIRKDLPQ